MRRKASQALFKPLKMVTRQNKQRTVRTSTSLRVAEASQGKKGISSPHRKKTQGTQESGINENPKLKSSDKERDIK